MGMTTKQILQGIHDWALQKVQNVVYDVSEHNPTGGPNSDGKFTLEYILNQSNVDTLIPSAIRKGGMSIKFAQSSDNKYVQCFLTKDEWSVNAGDWEKMNLEEEVSQLGQQLGGKIYDADLVFAGIENKTINLGVEPDDQIVFQMDSSDNINVKVSEILSGSVVNALVTIEDSDYHIVTISADAATSLIFTKLNDGEQTIHIKVFKNNPNASIKGLTTKDSEQVVEINNTQELVNARTNGFLNIPTSASAKKVLEIVSNVFFFNENNSGGIYYWKTLMIPSQTLAYFMIWDGTTTFAFQIDGARNGKTTYNLTANDHPEVHCQFTVDWSIGFISPLQDTTLNLAIVSSPYGEYLKEYVDGQKFEKVNPRSVFTSYQAQVLTDLNDALPNTKYMLTIDATHKPANLPTDYPVNPVDNALLETIVTNAYPGLIAKYQTIRSFQLGGYHYYRSYTSNYGWTAWTTVSDLPIYEIGTGKKYTTLRAGIEAATKVRNADVYIYAGTYDLTQEFATELADSSYNHSFGLFLKNGVKLHFLAGSYVKAIVDMSSGDDVRILNWFSPFEIHGDFEIDGLNIEVQNTRYCVHDDTDGNEVLGTYRNCVMVNHTTSSSQYAHGQCIGGGIVVHKHITIDNCVFNASKDGDANIPAVFYHNGTGAIDDSKIFVKDCYFADNNQLGVYSYGQSQIISYMYACGNSLSNANDIFAEKLNQDQPYDNMDVVAWNNEFRDNL